jgi:hypothetical protein
LLLSVSTVEYRGDLSRVILAEEGRGGKGEKVKRGKGKKEGRDVI